MKNSNPWTKLPEGRNWYKEMQKRADEWYEAEIAKRGGK